MKKFNIKDVEKKVFSLERLEQREFKRNTSGRFNRFGAYFIDLNIQNVILALVVLFMYILAYRNRGTFDNLVNINALPDTWQIPTYVLSYFIIFSYNVFIPYFLYEGQTFGKKLIGIKIVKSNGEKASLKDYILRYFATFPETTSHYTVNGLIFAAFMTNPTATLLNNIGLSISALSILIAMIQKERRSIHDFLSNTKVVSVKNLEVKSKKLDENKTEPELESIDVEVLPIETQTVQ